MDQKDFLNRLNLCFKTNKKDNSLLSHENKFLRAQFLLNNISSISKTLSLFDFKDKILFEDNLPFIEIEEIKFLLNHKFYLKHSGKKFLSSSIESIDFLNYFKINPKNIIDLGACWGEFSLFLSKRFPKSKIYSIEGSEKNFNVLKINLNHNLKFSKNIEPHNIIISDKDGFEEILDSVSTMNVIKRLNDQIEGNYNNIKACTIHSFLSKLPFEVVDLLKIDTQGFEDKVLAGCNQILKNNIISAIESEIMLDNVYDKYLNFSDLEKYLIPNNFRLVGLNTVNNNLFSGIVFFADILYFNKNKFKL